MSFSSGPVSFRRFAVLGKAPKSPDQELLDRLSAHALRPGDFGVSEEVEYGWNGGRHILDGNFRFENNVYADALHFALRIDTNRVPGALKKAWQMIEEEAVAKENPSGFISKNQKREVKDSLKRRIDKELREGHFRRSKLLPILWDLATQTLYCPAAGASVEKLAEIFERTFGLELLALTAGNRALRSLEHGHKRDYEDFRPTRFVHGPNGESDHPDYPWVAKGPQPKDFLGNEFLLWLWHEADARHGTLETEAGQITLFFDKSLQLDCAYGQTGKDALLGDGPSRMPEARDALRSGKLPRKAGLVLEANRQQYTLTLGAEGLAIGSLKLPDIEEAESPRVEFEERIALLRDFSKLLDSMYELFLKTRASSGWESQTTAIRKWILQPTKAAAA